MSTFFLSLWTWLNNPAHLLEVGVTGTFLAQLVTYLPAGFPGRTKIVNALHGIFPSPQVFVNGATKDIAEIEKLLPVVDDILQIVETGKTVPAPAAPPIPPAPETKP